jgi:hypothetical protein
MNGIGFNQATFLNNDLTDEFYLTYSDWVSRPELQNKAYVWDTELNDLEVWRQQYQNVFYANTVLYNLEQVSSKGREQLWNKIKGSALFSRAHAFYQIAQLFAPSYNPQTAGSDLGIPLRLSADFNVPSVRMSNKETYDAIIQDLNEALKLLPDDLPVNMVTKAQPTRAAVSALLARIYLLTNEYAKAKESAAACLSVYNALLDFNLPPVNASSSTPIPQFNSEMIFYAKSNSSVSANPIAKVDSQLYKSYDTNDLRKQVFFFLNSDKVTFQYKGSYNGGVANLFNGLAIDEVYLIRAEANARLNDVPAAMEDLNTLLAKRWKVGTFTSLKASSSEEALRIILNERKKELINRGTRWSDLKRLNIDSRFAINLKRDLNGPFVLLPNDLRYVLLIPREVITITSLQQNPR